MFPLGATITLSTGSFPAWLGYRGNDPLGKPAEFRLSFRAKPPNRCLGLTVRVCSMESAPARRLLVPLGFGLREVGRPIAENAHSPGTDPKVGTREIATTTYGTQGAR
jgi:hypothetical protein